MEGLAAVEGDSFTSFAGPVPLLRLPLTIPLEKLPPGELLEKLPAIDAPYPKLPAAGRPVPMLPAAGGPVPKLPADGWPGLIRTAVAGIPSEPAEIELLAGFGVAAGVVWPTASVVPINAAEQAITHIIVLMILTDLLTTGNRQASE